MSIREVRVFISHATEERKLADALATLFESFSLGTVSAWFSSDRRPSGGIDAGRAWRETLIEELEGSDAVVAVQTPLSLGRPWIMWECALASGTGQESSADDERGRRIVPIVYGLELGDLTNPLDLYQGYAGAEREAIRQLCERLGGAAGITVSDALLNESLDAYLRSVDLHGPRRTVASEQMELWRGRFDELVRTGRASEVCGVRDMMYDTLGRPFTPTDPSVHELLSKTLLDQGFFDEAAEEADFALSRVGDDPHLLHQKALALTEMGELRSAANIVGRIYELFPRMRTNPEVASLEGRIHRERWESSHDRADLDVAANAYMRVFEANPGDYYPGVNAASLLLAAGEGDRASNAYEKVLQRCQWLQDRPRVSFWVDFTTAEALIGTGRADEAVAEYERGLARSTRPQPRQLASALKGFERLAALVDLDPDVVASVRETLRP